MDSSVAVEVCEDFQLHRIINAQSHRP